VQIQKIQTQNSIHQSTFFVQARSGYIVMMKSESVSLKQNTHIERPEATAQLKQQKTFIPMPSNHDSITIKHHSDETISNASNINPIPSNAEQQNKKLLSKCFQFEIHPIEFSNTKCDKSKHKHQMPSKYQ